MKYKELKGVESFYKVQDLFGLKMFLRANNKNKIKNDMIGKIIKLYLKQLNLK